MIRYDGAEYVFETIAKAVRETGMNREDLFRLAASGERDVYGNVFSIEPYQHRRTKYHCVTVELKIPEVKRLDALANKAGVSRAQFLKRLILEKVKSEASKNKQ